MTRTWDELKADFTGRVATLYASTWQRLSTAITTAPDTFRARMADYLAMLAQIRANLAIIAARLPNPPRTQAEALQITTYAEYKSMYDALVAGISANAVPVRTEIGIAPAVVVTVGLVGLTAAGVAWAVATWEYAASLRDQTGFLVKELDARVESMRSGAPLPATTAVPAAAPTAPREPSSAGWGWLVGGLALAGAAAVFVVPKLGKG